MFPFRPELKLDSKPPAAPQVNMVHYSEVLRLILPLLTPARRARIEEVVQRRCFDVTPVLENIYDRGNISAVLRSAEAFGFGLVHVVESERLKESQRTTAGADKWVEIQRWRGAGWLQELKSQGKQIVATCLDRDTVPIYKVDFSRPTALVLGNEKEGISAEVAAGADYKVALPMYGFVQSFNISVAAALAFTTVVQDRISRRGSHGDLSDQQREILRAIYAMRTLDSMHVAALLPTQLPM